MLWILTTIAMPTNKPWTMCSFPLFATPRGMSEFISSEYTSPITRRRKAATRAAKPIIKIAQPMSMVLLVCSVKGESLGVNVLSARFQPPASCLPSHVHVQCILTLDSLYDMLGLCGWARMWYLWFLNMFYGFVVKVFMCFEKKPSCPFIVYYTKYCLW